jgi:hypothetical protein
VGVEFRLGRQDGRKSEDFIARRPRGVSAIILDTVYARYQRAAAEEAGEAGLDVLFDPATERMADAGFEPAGLPYFDGEPFDLHTLAANAGARTRLVEGVLAAHPDVTTIVTPPHFFVHDDRSARLNIALAEETTHATDKPVRAVLLTSRKFASNSNELVHEYVEAGIQALDLRLTPLGGDDESLAKIRSVFAIADRFTAAGIEVTLGFSGNIGHCAVALGHATHYSVGIGLREQVNHSAAISRQKAPPREPDPDGSGPSYFGAAAGIYLPGPAITIGRKAGNALLQNTDIRTRIGCRIGSCGTSVSGPALDPREHYLHARSGEMDAVLSRPAPWRPTIELDRLARALELRNLINRSYLSDDVRPLNTRTLQSLIEDIQVERAQTA